MGNQCEKHFCNEDHPSKLFPHWMKSIPDSALITTLTIPGTHNSCSFFGTAIAITQTWPIPLQLQAGIRYFDIRLRLYYNTLRLQHGIMNQKCTFDVILKHFKDFLLKQPSETIIMAVQNEYKETNCTKSMNELFNEYTKDYKDIIKQYEGKDIEIGSIRGKILFIHVFHSFIHKVPRVITQNEWVVNFPNNIKQKKQKIKTLFNKAVINRNDRILYINYLSGVSDYGIVTPARCAGVTNRLVFKFKGRLGVVLCDFPGENLIEYLIEQNYSSSPAPMQLKETEVTGNSRIGFINVNTKKYLALNEINEFCSIKAKFYFNVLLKNNSLATSNDDIKTNGPQFMFSGSKVKVMSIKHIFESEMIIVKANDNKALTTSNKAIQYLKTGDIVFLCKDITINKQFLCSNYQLKQGKEQKVKLASNINEPGCEWMIDVLRTENDISV